MDLGDQLPWEWSILVRCSSAWVEQNFEEWLKRYRAVFLEEISHLGPVFWFGALLLLSAFRRQLPGLPSSVLFSSQHNRALECERERSRDKGKNLRLKSAVRSSGSYLDKLRSTFAMASGRGWSPRSSTAELSIAPSSSSLLVPAWGLPPPPLVGCRRSLWRCSSLLLVAFRMGGARRNVSFVAPLLGRNRETIREEWSFLVFGRENKKASSLELGLNFSSPNWAFFPLFVSC
jgi:hypothetical protein